MKAIISTVTVAVPVRYAYRAFTNATSLSEWLCNLSTVEARPNGRIYLWWEGDFYSSGHYLEVEENKKVRFRWYANIDAAATEVLVEFREANGQTHITLTHFVPNDEMWTMAAENFKREWDNSLENLQSVLETGIDLRIANRPMVGVIPGDFTPEQAVNLGISASEGFRLDGVVDGMGAEKAGLQKNDVIVELNGITITNDFHTFNQGLAGKKGGDSVKVVFYRGAEKKTIDMELTRRPMPDVPTDPAELAKIGQEKYQQAIEALEKTFEGATHAQVTTRPAPEEWSALEVVAHLLHTERFFLQYFGELMAGYERFSDGYIPNYNAAVEATVAVYPTTQAMLEAFKNTVKEFLHYAAHFPREFAQNKGSYHRIGALLINGGFHINSHLPQIKAAIAAAA